MKIQVFQSLGRPQYKPYSFTRHHRRASLLKVCYSRYFFSVKFWVRRSKHWAIRPQMAEHSSIWDILQGNLRYAFQVSKYDMRLVFLKNCPLGSGFSYIQAGFACSTQYLQWNKIYWQEYPGARLALLWCPRHCSVQFIVNRGQANRRGLPRTVCLGIIHVNYSPDANHIGIFVIEFPLSWGGKSSNINPFRANWISESIIQHDQ